MSESRSGTETTAARVTLSYPADLSQWGRLQLDNHSFKSYLKRTKTATPGETWSVFLDVGCCGDTYDVPLRVESVDGGVTLGPDTNIIYKEREACGLDGGWAVQSAGKPADQDSS